MDDKRHNNIDCTFNTKLPAFPPFRKPLGGGRDGAAGWGRERKERDIERETKREEMREGEGEMEGRGRGREGKNVKMNYWGDSERENKMWWETRQNIEFQYILWCSLTLPSYRVLSYSPVMSYPPLSFPITFSPLLISTILLSSLLSCLVLSYPILSYPPLSYPLLSFFPLYSTLLYSSYLACSPSAWCSVGACP